MKLTKKPKIQQISTEYHTKIGDFEVKYKIVFQLKFHVLNFSFVMHILLIRRQMLPHTHNTRCTFRRIVTKYSLTYFYYLYFFVFFSDYLFPYSIFDQRHLLSVLHAKKSLAYAHANNVENSCTIQFLFPPFPIRSI